MALYSHLMTQQWGEGRVRRPRPLESTLQQCRDAIQRVARKAMDDLCGVHEKRARTSNPSLLMALDLIADTHRMVINACARDEMLLEVPELQWHIISTYLGEEVQNVCER